MENSFQTSFIPKKPILANGSSPIIKSNAISISMVVSVFILVVMLLAFGGLYFYYNFYLLKNKETLSSNLAQIRDSFDKNTISELEMYDKRTTVSSQILKNHLVLSPLFELINELTLSSIQYTRFSHSTLNNVFSIKMSGIARDYKSIALQADVLNSSKGQMLKNVVFSNLNKDKNNYVVFDIDFNVDPALLSYTNNITSVSVSSPDTSTQSQGVTQVVPATVSNPTGQLQTTQQP
jgi:hypothetical protein